MKILSNAINKKILMSSDNAMKPEKSEEKHDQVQWAMHSAAELV